MFYKVENVKIIEKYILLIIFKNGVQKYYDVERLFDKWKMFRILKNNDELFNQVKVDKGGYGISWNDEIDISCNELWENGKEFID